MIPVTQTRTGEPDGNCFATSLASVFETSIPEFDLPGTDYWANVDDWLRSRGCSYRQEPITDPAPRGWHLIEGLSPRGGQHAIVGYNGRMVHDPHPQDGTGRGLVRPERWGVLERVGARDAAPLSGKRLNAAAEPLLVKHDELMDNPARCVGSYESRYRATRQPVVDLVKAAGVLLGKARLDDNLDYWQAKLRSANESLRAAERLAAAGDHGRAVAYLDCAFSLAHTVIDKLRTSGRARDMGQFAVGSIVMTSVPTGAPAKYEVLAGPRKGNSGDAVYYQIKPVIGTRPPTWIWSERLQSVPARAQDAKSRRARLHRALDAVMNTAFCDGCDRPRKNCICEMGSFGSRPDKT